MQQEQTRVSDEPVAEAAIAEDAHPAGMQQPSALRRAWHGWARTAKLGGSARGRSISSSRGGMVSVFLLSLSGAVMGVSLVSRYQKAGHRLAAIIGQTGPVENA